MRTNIIENIFCCPECKSDLKIKNSTAIECSKCKKEYDYDNNLIDFGVEEEKITNNWSGSTSEEELNLHLKQMAEDGYFKDEDIANIFTDITPELILQHDDMAIGSIRKNYYLSENKIIVDLATGYGTIFDPEIGQGMDFEKLKGKAIILTDLSKFVLKQVRDMLKEKTKNINMIYAVCDIEKLPFKNSTIDYISSVSCLTNSSCSIELLTEVKRVLGDKKRLEVFEILCEDNSRSQNYLLKVGSIIEYTTTDRLKHVLKESNFSEIDINILYSGNARMANNILPLKGEKNIVTLINAVNNKD